MTFEIKKIPKQQLEYDNLNIRMKRDTVRILAALAKEAGVKTGVLAREMILHCLKDLNKIE